jgi:signal transduction histidine kinase
VIWNLLRNAIQASSADQMVRVKLHDDARSVIIDIVDHGAGIPPSMRERIFDAFVTTRSQGVGIGLAVVKQIVDAHGGTIEVLDTSGGGSTFRVVLARDAAKEAQA